MTYAKTYTIDFGDGGNTVKEGVQYNDLNIDYIITTLNGYATESLTFTNKTLSAPTLTGTVTCSGATLSGGTIKGASLSDTLTCDNATFSGGTIQSPTFTGTLTLSNATISGGTIQAPTLTGTLTCTNATFSGGTISGATLTGTIDCTGASLTGLASSLHILSAQTTNYSVQASDLGGNTTITNNGASGEINMTLPAGVDNYKCNFIVTDAQYLKVTADGSETFRYGATQSAGGGYVRSNTVGTAWTITWTGDDWLIFPLVGTLLYDE